MDVHRHLSPRAPKVTAQARLRMQRLSAAEQRKQALEAYERERSRPTPVPDPDDWGDADDASIRRSLL